MTIKVKKSDEVEDTVAPTGELPAAKPTDNAKGNPVDAAYSDQVFDSTNRKYVKSDTGDASKRSVPDPVKKVSEAEDADWDTQNIAGSPLPDENPEGTKTPLGGAEPSTGSAGATNSDKTSEARRTNEYLQKKKLLEAAAKLEEAELNVKAMKLQAEELELAARIKKAQELVKPNAIISSTRAVNANGVKSSALEGEVSRPSAWLRATIREENVPTNYIWHINKEKIFENYNKKYLKSVDSQGIIEESDLPKGSRSYAGEAGSVSTVTGPPSNDFMRIMSEQVLVLPSGKVVTPIRQFCETKILPPGTKESFFYDFGAVTFNDVTEGGDGTFDPGTATVVSSPVIRSAGTSTTPRGTRVTLGYSQVEESPIDIIAATNRAFALESVHDESKRVFASYNTDSGSSGDASNRKAVGGGSKSGYWVDGNTGGALTTDVSGLGAMTFAGLLAAKKKIADQGFDTSNLVMYTSNKAIDDIIKDPDLDTYIGFSRPNIITEGTIERVAGINLVRSTAISSSTQSGGFRSVLFIPNVSFGLVSGRDLTMEASRRNEFQVIHVTGVQKINAVVKSVESTVRVSHI